jgi:thymidylate synthase
MLVLEHGRPFKIDEGSYAGDYRLEFDFVTVQITHPEARPFEPSLPVDMKSAGIPDPVEPGYILGDDPSFIGEPYIIYLMTGTKKPDEDYTYGQRLNAAGLKTHGSLPPAALAPAPIFDQVQHVIDKYRIGKFRNNQLCMSVAQPGDMLLNDPPCLQMIDTRVQDGKLHFMPYFRSWDLWGGFPANLGGLQVLKEYMAGEIGIEPGETIAASKGLHIYRYVWELAEMRRRKDGFVAKFLREMEDETNR